MVTDPQRKAAANAGGSANLQPKSLRPKREGGRHMYSRAPSTVQPWCQDPATQSLSPRFTAQWVPEPPRFHPASKTVSHPSNPPEYTETLPCHHSPLLHSLLRHHWAHCCCTTCNTEVKVRTAEQEGVGSSSKGRGRAQVNECTQCHNGRQRLTHALMPCPMLTHLGRDRDRCMQLCCVTCIVFMCATLC